MKCGLLGRKLGHSYSPQIHKYLGDYPYVLFEKEPEDVGDFLQNGDFDSINVTIPYKKDVIPYCDSLSETAQKLGAVNTIVRRNGKLVGHNTDHYGFSSMLRRSGLRVAGKKVLVLGTGGASVTVQQVLHEQNANVIVISRSGENNYENLHLHDDARVIVNCTPVGMYPENGVSPLPLAHFTKLEGVLDLIYNPARTKLLMDAEDRGLVAENGLWMLVSQAKESAEWFLNEKINDSIIEKIHSSLKSQMENIILVGMPGCGKSTIAKLLAQHLGLPMVDADAAIVETAGCTIPEIFARGGEAEFRAIETQVLENLGKRSGIILATGGGCVTRDENYALLHQNGKIIWIRRPIDALPTDGRPLSKKGSMEEMYEIRRPLYQRFADLAIDNIGTPEDALRAILAAIE